MMAVSSSAGPDEENELSALKSTNPVDFQQTLIEEPDFLPQYQDSTSRNALVLRDSETQMNQQQGELLQDAVPEVPGASDSSEEPLSLYCPPSPTMVAAICQMVEDPYFDTAMSSPSSEEAPKDGHQEWRCSSDFIVPSVLTNDQELEPNATAPGKRSDPKSGGGTRELHRR